MKDSAEALKETVPYYLKHVAEQDQTEAEMPIGRVATWCYKEESRVPPGQKLLGPAGLLGSRFFC